jgi:hypothetical protein
METEDIVKIILSFIENGREYKSASVVCKLWRSSVIKLHGKYKFHNQWCLLVDKFMSKNIGVEWDWKLLSNNPNMNFKLADRYPDNPWDWDIIIENESLDKNYKKIGTMWSSACDKIYIKMGLAFTGITFEDIAADAIAKQLCSNKDELKILIESHAKNGEIDNLKHFVRYLDPLIIDKYYKDVSWDWNKLSKNKLLTYKFIKKYYRSGEKFNWESLSSNSLQNS